LQSVCILILKDIFVLHTIIGYYHLFLFQKSFIASWNEASLQIFQSCEDPNVAKIE